MYLYDTLSQNILPVTPEANHARLYVCGITPYDTTHLGHAFTYTSFDILIRFLEMEGTRVTYVQNVTDIDDDILRKARQVGEDWRELGNRWTAHFIRDMQALNVRPPDHYPRATDVIPQIVEMVTALIAADRAYVSRGNVYYRVAADPEFGKLSHLAQDEMLPIANERGNRPDDPHKSDPLDFVLWQAQAPDEPAWPSPWGAGRPGWHIECSAMSTHFLGGTIDIHSGGSDLVFPHHECEIAQVEPLNQGQPFVRNWMHVAMVHHEGEKMSKSLGNLVMVRDLLKTCSADALRVYLAMHHYRETWSHDERELEQAGALATKMGQAAASQSGSGPRLDAGPQDRAFRAAMRNDLDTPQALTILSDLADEILAGEATHQDVRTAQQALANAAVVFGLRLGKAEPEERVQSGWDRHLERFT